MRSVVSAQDAKGGYRVKLATRFGEAVEYDHVILACHSDTSLALLRAGGGVTDEQERILSAFEWRSNEAVLHLDEKVSVSSQTVWCGRA